MNGTKMTRNVSSLVNRTNICGGPIKAGFPPRVGWFLESNVNFVRAPQTLPIKCNYHNKVKI